MSSYRDGYGFTWEDRILTAAIQDPPKGPLDFSGELARLDRGRLQQDVYRPDVWARSHYGPDDSR